MEIVNTTFIKLNLIFCSILAFIAFVVSLSSVKHTVERIDKLAWYFVASGWLYVTIMCVLLALGVR